MARKAIRKPINIIKEDKVLLLDPEGDVIGETSIPERIPIFPLYQRPIFPGILTMVGADPATSAWIRDQLSEDKLAGLILVDPEKLKGEESEQLTSASQLYRVGTIAYVLHWVELPDGSCQFMMSTLKRFRVRRFIRSKKHFMADIEPLNHELPEVSDGIKASAAAILSALKDLIPHNPTFSQEMKLLVSKVDINEPHVLPDLAASMTSAKSDALQQVLEIEDMEKRMEYALLLLREEHDLSLLKEKIRERIDQRVSKHQREYFLREQLKEIKKELGMESDRKELDLLRFQERFKALELSDEAQERVEQEMDRYEMLEEHSSEFQVVHQYLECIASLPWGSYSKDRLGLVGAERTLNKEHYGLDDVKERILEFIGVSKLRGGVQGSILCLVGPPGVGKTSLGRSVANALGREFYRFSVGGLTDEAELKGHRRTYIGAMPGRLIQALRSVKTANPVIMLDELDKVGKSYRGDPLSVLLEILDPEQNSEFLDHYLDLRFDLSNVLFIATANVLDTIPQPLIDRMEVLRLSGYIIEEKIKIAQRHLIPKMITDCGLEPKQLKFQKSALRQLVIEYARETGVRSLEKKLRTIGRKVATRRVRGNEEDISIRSSALLDYLGPATFKEDPYHKQELPGVVRGLAWTSLGGSTLNIETILLSNNSKGLKLTGQLGEVMQESSTIAYSYIQSLLVQVSGKTQLLKKNSVHLHVPEGATPKDGPSAGIAIATSILSLALEKAVPATIAMTGEITLTGHVLPVGGSREKVVGGRLAGITTFLFPEANEQQFAELPEYLKKGLTIHFVKHFKEVANLTLGFKYQ